MAGKFRPTEPCALKRTWSGGTQRENKANARHWLRLCEENTDAPVAIGNVGKVAFPFAVLREGEAGRAFSLVVYCTPHAYVVTRRTERHRCRRTQYPCHPRAATIASEVKTPEGLGATNHEEQWGAGVCSTGRFCARPERTGEGGRRGCDRDDELDTISKFDAERYYDRNSDVLQSGTDGERRLADFLVRYGRIGLHYGGFFHGRFR